MDLVESDDATGYQYFRTLQFSTGLFADRSVREDSLTETFLSGEHIHPEGALCKRLTLFKV